MVRGEVLCCAVIALACGSSHMADEDASTLIDSGVDAPVAPVEPVAPQQPSEPVSVAWECPAGWESVEIGSAQACRPWAPRFERCPGAERRFVSDASCSPFGTACGDGWPSDLPEVGVVFVQADADPDGDGSALAPFQTIARALQEDAETIAIATGVYRENLRVDRAVSIIGACSSETIIEGARPVSGVQAVVETTGAVSLRDISVRGTQVGVSALASELELRRVEIVDVVLGGIVVGDSASVTAFDTVISGVEAAPSAGSGVLVNGAFRMERGIIEDASDGGVTLLASGASVELVDTVIRRTTSPEAREATGVGIIALGDVSIDLERVALLHNTLAQSFMNAGGTFSATDLYAHRTQPGSLGVNIGGLHGLNGTVVSVERALLSELPGVGLTVQGANASMSLRDVVLWRNPTGYTAPPAESEEGVGLIVATGATGILERVHIEEQQGTGIALDDGADATLQDVRVHRMVALGAGTGGRALVISRRAQAELQRVEITEAVESAIYVLARGSRLFGTDLRIADVASRPSQGLAGFGIASVLGGEIELSRTRIDRASEAAIAVVGRQSRTTLSDLTIANTRPRACATSSCEGAGMGHGIGLVDEAHMTLERFHLHDNALAGMQLARGAGADLSDGLIEGNAVGLNLQDAELDLAELPESVTIRDNESDTDSSALPTVEPAI